MANKVLSELASKKIKDILDNPISIKIHILLYIIIGIILINIVAYFPSFEYSVLGIKHSVEFFNKDFQIILQFILSVIYFFLLLIGVIIFHVWIIINFINIGRFLIASVEKILNFLNNL